MQHTGMMLNEMMASKTLFIVNNSTSWGIRSWLPMRIANKNGFNLLSTVIPALNGSFAAVILAPNSLSSYSCTSQPTMPILCKKQAPNTVTKQPKHQYQYQYHTIASNLPNMLNLNIVHWATWYPFNSVMDVTWAPLDTRWKTSGGGQTAWHPNLNAYKQIRIP